MQFTCDHCTEVVTGAAEHCTVCHETFAATAPGDAHRVGDHATFTGPDRRRCRTPEEMRAGGMWQDDRRDYWHGHWRRDGIPQRMRGRPSQTFGATAEGGS